MERLTAFTLAFISVFLVFHVLVSAQAIFIPFLIALVIAYLIIAIAEGIRKLKINGTQIPRLLSFLLAGVVIGWAIYLIGSLLSGNISSLVESAPVYQEKLTGLIHWFYQKIGKPVPDLYKNLQEFDFGTLFAQIVFVVTEIARLAGLITIYVLFILMEYHFFDSKVLALFRTHQGKESAKKILKKIASQIQSYLRIKTLLSLLTATCSYLLLVFVGVDFAEFWALLIFFLNYIPTIGSIIATIFPSLLTLLQFGTALPFIVVTCGLVLIQFLIGNILEPRIMGKHFNLSGLVIILSLTASSHVWGIIGMLLCVPLLMVLSIILSNFEKTRPIVILLSQSGEIEE